MTYNIGAKGQDRLIPILELITKISPDILVLNELSWLNAKSLELKIISQKINLPFYFFANSAKSNNHLSLFSRFRINDVTLVKGLKNSGVIVNVKTKSRDISIAGVHLASNTEDVRLAEINKIVFHQKNTKHKIILGDLNSISKENQVAKTNPLNLPEEPVRHEVTSYLRKAGYIDAALKTGKQFIPTVPLTKDHNITYYNLRLDYIFLSKELSKNLIDYRVIRDKTVFSISDHLPIITNIR